MKIFIALIVAAIVGTGAYFLIQKLSKGSAHMDQSSENNTVTPDTASTTAGMASAKSATSTIGTSVEKRSITAYHYGSGETELLLVGGIHGGYSWNTALLAYELMDHLNAHPDVIPKNVRVTIIPLLNPDGLAKVTTATDHFTSADVTRSESARMAGRFNAHKVDLNRNFDCAWQSKGTWQNKPVSGGEKAFSEPESAAIKTYIDMHRPAAVIVWYSAAGGVFASKCNGGVLSDTHTITNLFASASGYKAYEDFDFYEVTGDMANWLAGQKIPAISVLLTSHEDLELDKNKAGVEALIKHYAK